MPKKTRNNKKKISPTKRAKRPPKTKKVTKKHKSWRRRGRHQKLSYVRKKVARYIMRPPKKRGRKIRTATKYSKSRERISAQRSLVEIGKDNEFLLTELVEAGKKRGFVTDSEILHTIPNIEENLP